MAQDIAGAIGRRLNLPVIAIERAEIPYHFGCIGLFFAINCPASSLHTGQELGWLPSRPGLIADLDHPRYFEASSRGLRCRAGWRVLSLMFNVRTTLCGWVLLSLATSSWGADTPPDPKSEIASLDEVVVEGERPGPGIWRVSKGNHDLWILPSLEPLPKKMLWRSQLVEQRIAESQVVLAPPSIDANVGFFRGLTLIPSLLRAEKSPDGQNLEHVLPHDLYIRWLALRVKYLSSGDDEKKRPMVAAFDLYRHAIDRSGLTSEPIVWDTVEKQARKAHVAIQPVKLTIAIDDPKSSIRELEKIPRAAEVECFAKTLDRVETDLQPMVKRANYWSMGDIEGLRSLPYPDERTACMNAFMTAPKLREQFETAYVQTRDLWLSTAERALDQNVSTFAVVPLTVFLEKDGALDRLRAKGYIVKDP